MFSRLYFTILVLIALFNLRLRSLVICIPSLNGRYTRNIQDFKLTVPAKVTQEGCFRSFHLPHFYQQNYERGKMRRKRSLHDPDIVHYRLEFNNELFHTELWPNHGLISPNVVVENNQPNVDVSRRILRRIDDKRMCHYTGHVRGIPGSRVALSTCDGLAGYIATDGKRYFIEPVDEHVPNMNGEQLHVVYERYPNEDELGTGQCGTNTDWEDAWRQQFINKFRLNNNMWKRSSESVHRYLEVLVVCDKRFIDYHRHRDHQNYVLTVMNMVADFYHDYSSGNQMDVVVVRIIYLEKEEEEIDLVINQDADNTLKSFCAWQQKINPKDIASPNHHDIAVLLTRHDICTDNMENCGLAGLAYVASACSGDKPCAINEDSGLVLAIVVAHEMGHVMGCSHDKEGESSCAAQDEDESFFVMAPFVHLFTTRWSTCSKGFITSLFENGLGECLNDEPQDTIFKFRNVLPGVVYDADAQCEINFPKSKYCSFNPGEMCDNLVCETKPKTCMSNGEPPADGTKCAENMWCFRKKCVEIGARPAAIDGGWGKWGELSDCSRTCGGGVQTQSRECDSPIPEYGGRFCIGERKKIKICNMTPCPMGSMSYRDVQCKEKDSEPFFDEMHKWSAYFKKDDVCALYCVSETNVFAKLDTRVKDGTPCQPGTYNMCISGTCKKVGCDGEIDSDASEDICGVCNGDGTQCKLVDEIYTKDIGRHYVKVAVFPAGARNILIEELEPSMNTIAISNADEKKFFLNGGKIEERDGEKKFGSDVDGIYKHTEPRKENLIIHGPLAEDLVFHVCFFRPENVGYHYKYAEPGLDVSYTPHYHWEVADWEPCTQKCDGGIQKPKFSCMESKAGRVSGSFCESLEKPSMDAKRCNESPCKTKWKVGKWGVCKACKYKSGVRSREVECVRESALPGSDDVLVEDKECHDKKPGSHELCNSHKKCKQRRETDGLPDELMEDVWRQLHRYRRYWKHHPSALVKKLCHESNTNNVEDERKYEKKLNVGKLIKDRNEEMTLIEVPMKQSHLTVDLSDQAFETMGDKMGDTLDTDKAKIFKGKAAAEELKKVEKETPK